MAKKAEFVVLSVGETVTGERCEVSPYSYQVYPKTPSALKGEILGEERGFALTSGKGKNYLYFRRETKVEWMLISPAAAEAIGKGGAVKVAVVEEAAETPADEAKSE